ncbi:NAD(P)(+)--arginine ADP-ribosyltransferase 2-like [Pithys albifrons albifrons]|uniref:NAD(P)(+)--arginine ADP-ribosyltransferase 2-like n=1 Tax=Pithys albifrons albifrons TaxID=3385563 RepID=UPI003A5CCA89
MELLPLVLVLLAGTLATTSPLVHWSDRSSGIRVIELTMAPNSFDDQYRGCRDKMARALRALNRTEFASNSDYAKAWGKAVAKWQNRPSVGSRLRPEQAIALMAYTMEDGLYMEFNKATREGGTSRHHYLHKFHFKVMHFLLTKALDDLRKDKSHPECLHVFRGVEGVQFTTKPGRFIRFGQFASTSLLKNVSEHYGTDTLFEVDTCHGANIQNFSHYPEEEEVLIPPFETFKVTNVSHQSHTIYIQLRSHGMHSKYSCAWLRARSVHWEPPSLSRVLLAALALAVATVTP